MKIVLRNVKIYGFDPNTKDDFNRFSVILYISPEDRELIDSYIYGKCLNTKENEIIFYGKSKHQFFAFDAEKKKIETPINEVFFADVSILIDEFENRETGETIRYSKCLGIQYLSSIEGEKPRIPTPQPTTFDEIFGGEVETAKPNDSNFGTKTNEEIMQPNDTSTSETEEQPIDDLPF